VTLAQAVLDRTKVFRKEGAAAARGGKYGVLIVTGARFVDADKLLESGLEYRVGRSLIFLVSLPVDADAPPLATSVGARISEAAEFRVVIGLDLVGIF
jgi:hypothetical protein